MWAHKHYPSVKPTAYLRRRSAFIDKDFQVRYTLLVIGAATLGTIVAILPIHYFLNENYNIFVELAYDHAPKLIDYLEKERIWMNTFLFGTFLGLFVFFSFLGFRITARIVGPIKVLHNHLRKLSRGHWSQNDLSIRKSDEFHDLIESYNYFLKSFRTNAKRDFNRIKKLQIDPNNRDAYQAWKELLREKSHQLNISTDELSFLTILSDEGDVESHDSHHAS